MKKIIATIPLLLLLASCQDSVSAPSVSQPGREEITTLVAVGDISCSQSQRNSGKYDCVDADVAQIVRTIAPNYTLLLGDIQYNSHTTKNFTENFGKIWEDIIPSSFAIPGNHEYAEGGAKGYYEAWGAKFPKPGYYSMLINSDWVVIGLNTNDECKYVDCEKGSEQYAWLESELNKHHNQCVIPMMHHPRYSSGNHGNTRVVKDMFDLMHSHNVPLVLAGHDHHYERFATQKNGEMEPASYVVGTGGKDLRRAKRVVEGSSKIIDDRYGVLAIEIRGKTVTTYFVDTDGNVMDAHSITCNK